MRCSIFFLNVVLPIKLENIKLLVVSTKSEISFLLEITQLRIRLVGAILT